jgi:restriction system protein
MTTSLRFDPYELELLESNGQPRWLTVFLFYTVDANKAGYLLKNKGTWVLTTEGQKAMSKGPVGLINAANDAYRIWAAEKKKIDSKLIESGIPAEEISKEKENEVTIDLIKEQAQESIINHIERMPWDTFQKLVEALLTAMGHFVDFNAPKGKDGGIDIVAYQDALGLMKPRIKVQVKHYPSNPIGPEPIRALKGVLHQGEEIGLFVTSGSFTNDAKRTARESNIHIRLIDGTEFIDLWQSHYNKILDEHKNLLPLQAIYFLGVNE